MPHYIQAQVDQLLFEQGEYRPLELLLQEGRLMYSDYEDWRNGIIDCLDQLLYGDHAQIRQQLMQAENYLQRLGWQVETITYAPWPNTQAEILRPLCFSRDIDLDARFHRSYHKSLNQPQMDLFTDAPDTNRVNGIVQALIDRNPKHARRLLDSLISYAPDHNRLGELERVVEAAEGLDTEVGDVALELRTLQQVLTPLVEDVLGKASRNLLVPLWRRLSTALHNCSYLPAEPELHLSYSATQALDWQTVKSAVEQVPQWQTETLLLQRHARACEQINQPSAALQSWMLLCWQAPQHGNVLESSNNPERRQQWSHFQELEQELPISDFPAWLLIIKPELVRILPEPMSQQQGCPDSYATVYELQRQRLFGDAEFKNQNAIDLRARLKQQHPVLFQYFLQQL